MSREHFIVIGNGPAGNRAALTLRGQDPDARITLISKDPDRSYRPHLLPDFIAGRIGEPDLWILSPEVYKEKGIKCRNGQKVVRLDPQRKELILDHKEVLSFTGLIIAAGGVPPIPEHLVRFKQSMFTLKTLEDARDWKKHLSGVHSVLIIGGDLTSLALTKALLRLKKRVYFMLNESAFWPIRADETLFEEVSGKLKGMGVEVIEYRRLQDVTPLSGGGYEVALYETINDVRMIRVDMIGAFFGLVPDIGFLSGTGLRIDRGILVDEYLNVGIPGIYATGDCAQIYTPELRDYWISIGHENAVALGRIAALNLLGGSVRADIPLESVFKDEGIRVNTSWWMGF